MSLTAIDEDPRQEWCSCPHEPPCYSASVFCNRELVIFFVVAYVWAWLVFVPLVLFHAAIQWTIVGTFGPTVAALIAQRLSRGDFRAFHFIPSWPRVCVAIPVGVVLILFAYVILPSVLTSEPGKLNWSVFGSLSVYNYSSFLGGPLGEEPGWRGYALPRLEASCGPVGGSLLLAVLWAGWHLPLFFYPGWTSSTFWSFLLILGGMSILFTFVANLSFFSIIPAIAMHVTFNTVSRFLNGLLTNAQPTARLPFEIVMGLTGIATASIKEVVVSNLPEY